MFVRRKIDIGFSHREVETFKPHQQNARKRGMSIEEILKSFHKVRHSLFFCKLAQNHNHDFTSMCTCCRCPRGNGQCENVEWSNLDINGEHRNPLHSNFCCEDVYIRLITLYSYHPKYFSLLQKGINQQQIVSRKKQWRKSTSSKTSSSCNSSKSESSKKNKMRCVGGPIQTGVPSVTPVQLSKEPTISPTGFPSAPPIQPSKEPTHSPTGLPSVSPAQTSMSKEPTASPTLKVATTLSPSLVPTKSSYPSEIPSSSEQPTDFTNFNATNETEPPQAASGSPTQAPSGNSLVIGLIEICQCDSLDLCTSKPIVQGTNVRICSFASASNGEKLTHKFASLELESVDYDNDVNIIVDGDEVLDDTEQVCDVEQQKCYVSASADDFFFLPELPPRIVAKGSVVVVVGINATESNQVSLRFLRNIDLQKVTAYNAVNGVAETGTSKPAPIAVRKFALVFALYVSVVGFGIFLWSRLLRKHPTSMEYDVELEDENEDYD